MTKLLFCHDGPLVLNEENNKVYGIAHTDEVFNRYYFIADEVRLLIRLRKSSCVQGMNEINKEIIEAPNTSSIKFWKHYFKESKIIKNSIDSSDYIVIRIPGILGILCFYYAKRRKKKILVELVGDPYLAYKYHSLKGKILAPFFKMIYKDIMKKSEYSLYVTSEYLQSKYPTKGMVVSCSNVIIHEENFKLDAFRYDDFDRKEQIILGTISPLDIKFKNQEAVIRALANLKEQGFTNYIYKMVGSGDSSRLDQLSQELGVRDQIIFLGKLKKSEVFEFLDNIDIYIQPSKQEGLPRAVIEAMSRGTFCLGARTAGIPELLNDKYIFSNKKNNYKEISVMLLEAKGMLITQQVKINYEKAQKYSYLELEKRRNAFYESIKHKP